LLAVKQIQLLLGQSEKVIWMPVKKLNSKNYTKKIKNTAKEIAKFANLSIKKEYQIQDEKRLLSKDEAYKHISHNASVFNAILEYVDKID
jgi:DNA-binding cell septation regulator SpoVG